jgi:Ca2+-binding RTX toxin-like protein
MRGGQVRKVATLAALVAVVVLAFAGVALAVNKTCTKDPCRGTSAKDTLQEQTGNDVADNISGRKKGDELDASEFENDADELRGGSGNDNLDARDTDGKDVLNGGEGTDTCNGDDGDIGKGCEEGNLADD